MHPTRTETGYQLEGVEVDVKPYSKLPTQQARTLLWMATGRPQKEIAEAMGVKVCTIKQACYNLCWRFNTRSMRETVHQALREGVLRYTLAIMLCLLSATNTDAERCFRVARNGRPGQTARVRCLQRLRLDLLTA